MRAGDQPPVAVVGAGGFLGTALARGLADRRITTALFTRAAPFLSRAGRAASGLRSAGTVFWLATSINPALAESEPWRAEADREALDSMLSALAPPYPRVVVISSGGTVYDPRAVPPYREDTPTRPQGAYGLAKLALEQTLLGSPPGRAHGLVVRASNVYGPGQPGRSGQGVIAYWLRAAAAGEPITMYGDPASTRDYLYVDDAIGAFLAIAGTAGELPAVLNLGSGQPTSLGELAGIVSAAVGRPGAVMHEPGRPFDVPHAWLDVDLARRLLAWEPRVALATGVARAWSSVVAGSRRPLGSPA